MPSNYKNPYKRYHELFRPRSTKNVKFPYTYDRDRMEDMVAEMNFPEVVPAGSEYDLGQRLGMGKAFEQTHYRKDGTSYTAQDRAHYTPIPFRRALLAFTESTEDAPDEQLLTILEEFPHIWLYNNGYQGYPEMLLDLMLYGGSALGQSYTNPFAFEGFTHGLYNKDLNNDDNIDPEEKAISLNNIKKITKDLGLENLLVDFDGDGKKDYIVPGFTNASHGPIGSQYWLEAFRRGNIDMKTRNKALEVISDYHQKGRTDAYYDQAWNLNTDDWTKYVRGFGFTDGGDLARATSPILNTVNFFVENGSILKAKLELVEREKELEKAYKNKKITKEEYNKTKKQYELANEALVKRAYSTVGKDYADAIKSIKKGNVKQAAKSALKGTGKVADSVGGMKISIANAVTNRIANSIDKEDRKAIKEKTYAATDYLLNNSPLWVKDANKAANPYAKKAIRSTWDLIPEGKVKDALRDNKVARFARDWAKRYGLFKNGGVLNILDMLIY